LLVKKTVNNSNYYSKCRRPRQDSFVL